MATDQEIRDAGLKYVPKQKYLQNPFELPVEETPPASGGITNTNAFTGSDSPNIYAGYDETIGASGAPPFLNMSQPEFNKQLFETGPYANPYERKPGDTGLREDPDLIEKIRQNNSGLEESSDAQIMEDSRFKKMFTDYEGEPDIISQKKFNLMDYLPFGKNSLSGSVSRGINSFMPKSDIRTKNIKNYYGGSDNLDSIGRIQSGLMAGYNPVSGGFLNTITGGRYGDEPTYGLQNAYQKRIDMITKTLARQQKQVDDGKRKTVSDVLTKRRDKLRDEKGSELKSIQQSQKQKDYNTVQDAYRDDREGNTYSGGESTKGDDTSYNDPFDPGGGEKDGGFIDGSNRRPFNSGGRAGYFFGGRARLQGGGGADMGAPEKAAERASKGYGAAPDTGSKSGTNDYSSFEQNVNHQRAMRDNQREKPSTLDNVMNLGSEVNYLKNLYKMDPIGLGIGFGVNKLRTYIKNKNLPEEDKLSYNTNPLPTDNYFTEVQQKDLDASKMRGFKKQDYNSYLDQMNMLNDGTKVTPYEFQGLQDGSITTTGAFTAANGGRAMFKNGGLASIL